MRGSIRSSRSEIERVARRALEAALAVGRALDAVAFAGEPIGQGEDDAGLVFYEQDPFHGHARSRQRLRRGLATLVAGLLGNVSPSVPGSDTVNVLPSPGALFSVDLGRRAPRRSASRG